MQVVLSGKAQKQLSVLPSETLTNGVAGEDLVKHK